MKRRKRGKREPTRAAEGAPPRFHLLAKPSGSTCNLDCTYCFFLSKEALYPNDESRMSTATLEAYIEQLLASHRTPEVIVAWQGGEPTLMGLEFFKRSVELVQRYRRPTQQIQYSFQTNGVLLDDAWCSFLAEHDFLVGLSVDGPRDIHDTYRVNKGGKGTFDQVMRGLECLRKHEVKVNILCTVHAANQDHGREVYRFFRDELGVEWMQFIPIVERATAETLPLANMGWSGARGAQRPLYMQAGDQVTERSVGGEAYGRFLVDIYEEWIRADVGRIHVQLFDVSLHACFGEHLLCIHAPTCGYGPALEHNGDLYACDHFVEPKYKLGNIHETDMATMLASAKQRRFGDDKRDRLTKQCQTCDLRMLCNGGCPKDRFVLSQDGEPNHNYLCPGLYLFFDHIRVTMVVMAKLIQHGQPASRIMERIAAEDGLRSGEDPCPCESGRSFGACHGGNIVPRAMMGGSVLSETR